MNNRTVVGCLSMRWAGMRPAGHAADKRPTVRRQKRGATTAVHADVTPIGRFSGPKCAIKSLLMGRLRATSVAVGIKQEPECHS